MDTLLPLNFAALNVIEEQLNAEYRGNLKEFGEHAFDGRVCEIAAKTIEDCLPHGTRGEIETPEWWAIVRNPTEVANSFNLGFRPIGLFRTSYVHHLNSLYQLQQRDPNAVGDLDHMKSAEITNWLRAWMFMQAFEPDYA